MDMNDPTAAARAVAEVEQRRRRGAELVPPRNGWWYLAACCLMFALWGSIWDTPMKWRWMPMLAFVAAALMLITFLARRRARPLPVRLGWRYWLVVLSIAAAGIASALGAGFMLRALTIPLPFTLGGLMLGIGTWLIMRGGRHWRIGYVERIARGPW